MSMQAIVNTAPGQLEWRTLPRPAPGPGQVRIRTAACGICATDLEMIHGWERTGFPAVPGHEWSGTVDAVGAGVDAQYAGQRCVAENVWHDGGEVGFERAGGYAQYLLTEAANVQLLPRDFPADVAVLIEPLAVTVRALRRLRLEDRRAALILGDGPIGLLILMQLQRAGVRDLYMVGGRAPRLALARDLGATRTLDFHDAGGDLTGAIRGLTGGALPTVVEASGAASALAAGLQVARTGGKVLVIGDYRQARADFPWNLLLHRELELIGSNASAQAWPEATRLAASGELPLARLITHRFPAAAYEQGMATVRAGGDAIKVVLQWENA